MRLLPALLALSLLPFASPAIAMPADAPQRVVNALRQNDCRASDAEFMQLESSLGLTRAEFEEVGTALIRSGDILVGNGELRLSDAVCKGAKDPAQPDYALARQVNRSEAAMTSHIMALFAANGCRMSISQYQTYLERKFPSSAAAITTEVGEARFMMESMPYLLLEKGLLQRTADKNVVVSKGPGCN